MNIQQFEELLKNHDWTYTMSEDSRYYRRGQNQLKEIDEAIAQGGEEYQNLYNQYRNKFGV
jgi:phage-related tail protein